MPTAFLPSLKHFLLGCLLESLCSPVPGGTFFNGFILSDKPVETVPHCLWFIANLRENWSKLAETLQTSVNED